MRARDSKRVRFQVETLEGRATPGSLGAAAADVTPADSSGITITSATIDPRTGTLTVTGTAPANTVVGIQVTEMVGNMNIFGENDGFGTTVDAQGNFSATITPINGIGRFVPGDATVFDFDFFPPVVFEDQTVQLSVSPD